MKYHVIDNNLDENIVGKSYPQSDCITIAQAHLLTSWKHFNPKPKLKFSLGKKAILTDFINQNAISSSGFLISKKAKQILENYNLMEHQFFKSKLIDDKPSLEYFWLHLSQINLVEKIDYQNTVFFKTDFTFRDEIIKLKSYNDYLELKRQDKEARFDVEIESLSLCETFDKGLDLFTLLPFDNRIYISERLKEKIKTEKLTGLKIMPVNWIK